MDEDTATLYWQLFEIRLDRVRVALGNASGSRSWGLAQVTADTDPVTLPLRIATGGRVLTAQEAAHHQ